MKLILAAVLLFGLVHPGAKALMGSGLPLLPFCLLYLLVRLLVQVPFFLHRREPSVARGGWLLLGIGVVGAALQLSEFVGLEEGLPVSVVTFLVFTHPVWTLLFSRVINGDRITRAAVLKLVTCLVGVWFLASPTSLPTGSGTALLGPLFAGAMLSLWICLAPKLRAVGYSAFTVNFYYDLFVFLALALTVPAFSSKADMHTALAWLASPTHALGMITYSIGVGLLPNLLFFHGSARVKSFDMGLVMLLEPIIATSVSAYVWGDALTPTFLLGAAFILVGAVPSEVVRVIFSPAGRLYRRAFRSR